MSCHDGTPAGNFYKSQANYANQVDLKMWAYSQGLTIGLAFVGGVTAEGFAVAETGIMATRQGMIDLSYHLSGVDFDPANAIMYVSVRPGTA